MGEVIGIQRCYITGNRPAVVSALKKSGLFHFSKNCSDATRRSATSIKLLSLCEVLQYFQIILKNQCSDHSNFAVLVLFQRSKAIAK